jgi:hypothetical protein
MKGCLKVGKGKKDIRLQPLSNHIRVRERKSNDGMKTVLSTLEIHFLFFTPQGGAEKSMNEFREGTYPPLRGEKQEMNF